MFSKWASECSWAELAKLVNASFAGYMGTAVNHTPESLAAWFPANFVSPSISHVFYPSSSDEGNDPVAFVVLSVRDDRPGEVRLTSMGVVPNYQGKGTGSKALAVVIEAERKRGTRLLELECIEGNERGFKLYTRAGFATYKELWGWQTAVVSSAAPSTHPGLQQCTLEEVDTVLSAHAAPDLPWQARGMAKLADVAFRLDHAYCAITKPTDDSEVVQVLCLIVEPQWRRQGQGTRLAKAILAQYPAKKFIAKPIFPRENGEKFAQSLEPLGVQAMDIKLFQMRLGLA